MEVKCPKCKTRYKVSEAAIGRPVQCPKPECACVFEVSSAVPEPPGVPMATPPLSTQPPHMNGNYEPPRQPSSPTAPPAKGVVEPPGTVSPPPPPPGAVVPEPPNAINILSTYKKTTKSASSEVREKIKLGFRGVLKRAKAVKLKHTIHRLQRAIEGQLESLGTTVLQHRPPGIELTAEIAELARLQQEAAGKENTLASLQQTSGSGTVVKELKQEIARLKQSQRELMLNIGRKTESLKIDFPGATGYYSALDRLHTAQDGKQQELAALEEELGPSWSRAISGPNAWSNFTALASNRRLWIVGGSTLAGIVLLAVLWSVLGRLLVGDGVPGWARFALSKDTSFVAYLNIDELRESELLESLDQTSSFPDPRNAGLEITMEDLRDVVLLGNSDDLELVVFRLHEDIPLEEVVPSDASKGKTYKGVEYVQYRGNYLAKTDEGIYFTAMREGDLKKVISRLDRGDRPALDEKLRRLLAEVCHADHYVAARIDFDVDIPFDIKGFGAGASVGSSVNLSGALLFRKERQAERYVEGYEDFLDVLESSPFSARMSQREKRVLNQALDMARKIDFAHRDNLVRFSGEWSREEIEDLIDNRGFHEVFDRMF